MMILDESLTTKQKSNEDFKDNFVQDFRTRVNSFEDKYDAKMMFADMTGLSTKTFDRYFSGKTIPSTDNLILTYSFIYNIKDKKKVFTRLPELVQKILMEKCRYEIKNDQFTDTIIKSDCHHALYLMTMNNNTVIKEQFVSEWGTKNSIPAIKEMLSTQYIKEITEDVYIKGDVRSSFCMKEINAHSKFIVNTLTSTELLKEDKLGNRTDVHTLNLNTEGLSKVQQARDEYIRLAYQYEQEYSGNIQWLTTETSVTIEREMKQ